MLIFEREKDSLLQKANIYWELSVSNPYIKYFTWTIVSDIHHNLCDVSYDYAPAEEKLVLQEVTQ